MSGKLVIRVAVLVAATVCGFGPGPSRCEEPSPPEEQLRQIEAEGRQIASYLQAINMARDEFDRLAPAGTVTDRQVIIARRDGWHVLFVTNADPRLINDKPDLVAEIVFNPNTTEIRSSRFVDDPRNVPMIAGDHLLALESARIAATAVYGASTPFDASIFFEAGQSFRIHLMGRPVDGMIRFGGDFVLAVNRNPIRVSSIEPLHAATWPVALPAEATDELTVHSHLDNDLPTATDVALVMNWPTLAPHLLLTPRYLFRIEADGTIAYLGPNEPLDAGEGEVE